MEMVRTPKGPTSLSSWKCTRLLRVSRSWNHKCTSIVSSWSITWDPLRWSSVSTKVNSKLVSAGATIGSIGLTSSNQRVIYPMTLRIASISNTTWDHPITTSWLWTSFVTSLTLRKSQRTKKLTWCKAAVKSRIYRKSKRNLRNLTRRKLQGSYRRKSWRKK